MYKYIIYVCARKCINEGRADAIFFFFCFFSSTYGLFGTCVDVLYTAFVEKGHSFQYIKKKALCVRIEFRANPNRILEICTYTPYTSSMMFCEKNSYLKPFINFETVQCNPETAPQKSKMEKVYFVLCP